MIPDKTYNEQLQLARQSTDDNILSKLIRSPLMRMRRALARNSNLSAQKIDALAHDPVLNVSYLAVKHPKCTIKREFDFHLSPCVTCDIAEHTVDCTACEYLR
ncbi:MAG: hypothetical protein U9N30_09150 [Campylobacterota bacterium]|nr:hypothetical protein [Campylobacterota bacterium]